MQNSSTEILTVFLAATAIILLLIVLVVVFVVIYQRRVMLQKMRMQELEAEAHRQKMAAIVDTQEGERIRIARDLHDEVGAMLSTVKMSIKLAERKLAKAGVESSGLEETFGLLDTAIGSVREISHDLLPPSLESLGLASALQAFAEKTARLSGVPFACSLAGEPRRLPVRTELALFRVVQELCNNSLKHAQASRRTLQLAFLADSLRISFHDDGQGFDYPALRDSPKGLGLKGMESRVESFSGSLHIQSAPGQGFSAEIRVPV